MKKFKKAVLILMSSMLLCFPLAGCGQNNSEKKKEGPGYTNEREKYFFGMNESMQTWTFQQDPGNSPEMTAKLAGVLGTQSYRFRMELKGKDDVVRVASGNRIELGANVELFHGWLKLLQDEGITNILAQSTYFPKPNGYYDDGSINYPSPDSPFYDVFLDMIEETYALVAEEFPEIKYWEAGNETNSSHYMKPVGGTFTTQQMTQVTTDLMYYANKGMKRGNPNAVSVMPGLIFDNKAPAFLESIYDNILSGNFPSGGSDAGKGVTNTDKYFDVLNWHPYNFFTSDVSDTSTFMLLNNTLYDVAKAKGDDGKKVRLTEFGCTSTYKGLSLRDEVEAEQQHRLVNALKAIWEKLPFVETVDLFRMFDWEEAEWKHSRNSIETGFGMFTSPGYNAHLPEIAEANYDGPKPKLLCIEYYKYRFGNDADLSPLYQFYKPGQQ